MRRSAWTIGAAVLAALSLGVAACGGSDGDDWRRQRQRQDGQPTPAPGQKPGGKLTVLWTATSTYIDCGQTYYQMGYFICYATQKPLYSYKPDDGDEHGARTSPRAPPEVSEDGKTVTVKIKQGVKFSPPYNDEVTSKRRQVRDRARLLQHGRQRLHARPTTATSRAPRSASKPGTKISGITTPDDHDARPEVQARGRRRAWPRARSAYRPPRPCPRSTPRSSTPRRRRPTARTSSRPART